MYGVMMPLQKENNMNWSEFLNIVLKIFVLPLMGVLAMFIVNYIKVKTQQVIDNTKSDVVAKYIRMAQETVTACVIATNQTFVEALKKQGKFDKEAQMEAFNRTKEAVLNILSEDAQKYLIEAVGDIDVFLDSLIEAQVNSQKVFIVQNSAAEAASE